MFSDFARYWVNKSRLKRLISLYSLWESLQSIMQATIPQGAFLTARPDLNKKRPRTRTCLLVWLYMVYIKNSSGVKFTPLLFLYYTVLPPY